MSVPTTTGPGPAQAPTGAPLHTPLPTLTEVLAGWAQRTPDALAFAALPDGLTETARLTWAELHGRVQGLARELTGTLPRGARVMLLAPPGLEHVVATQACFAAGMVGVPVAPPSPRRPAVGLAGLQRVALDARIGGVLSTSEVQAALAPGLLAAPALADAPWILVDTAPAAMPDAPALPLPEPSELAYLQYTSGSTRDPRGVMLTHAQFSHNVATIKTHWSLSAADVGYSWLPPWHDMGLVSGIFSGLWDGFPTHLAPPTAIARRPHHWLAAISALGVTVSGAPDFLFRACTAQATPELLAGLDLSHWRRACSGSEPVRAATLRAFAQAFAPAGLRESALAPAYGLAEATLAVASTAAGEPPLLRTYDRGALAAGRAQPVPTGRPGGVEMVGNGTARGDQELAIVDPISLRRLPAGEVGELWTRGPSVGLGYWERPEESARTFGARIAGDADGAAWLRSGDVAFVDEGQLFIAGRLKDVIILNGVKRHAVDLELAAQESHPTLATRAAAAFSVDEGEGERVVVALEGPKTPLAGDDADDLLTAVRRAIATTFDVQPTRILLVGTGTIPKTTSGKVQRARTRAGLEAGEVPILREWNATKGKAS